MLLRDKNAIVYGAGGPVGRAVAGAFAREDARVFLTGRSLAHLEPVAEEIAAAGGVAEAAAVDARDRAAIERHAGAVAERAGGIDISFNAVAIDAVQGTPLLELSLEDFFQPVAEAMSTQFLTATAVARHMATKRSGVILTLTAMPARLAIPKTGGFGVAGAAIEGFYRTLAGEVGPLGIRVVCLRSTGSPDRPGLEFLDPMFKDQALLRRLPLLADVGNVAAVMASDHAGSMTGTVANITCGLIVD